MSHEVPERVGADILTLHDKDYLVTIDYYSNYWEVDRLPDTKASTAILKLKSHFARYGIPDQVVSDNGPQFTSKEFATFAKTWDFEYLTSSPGNSKANGKAESGERQLSVSCGSLSGLGQIRTWLSLIIGTLLRKR